MDITHYFIMFMGSGLAGLAVVAYLLSRINQLKVTNPKAAEIALAIRGGAMTFLREEYKIIAVLVAIVGAAICYFMSPLAALLFVFGCACSTATGLIGMHAATRANVRTTMAAQEHGEHG